MPQITRFSIKKLHGYRNIDLKLKGNTLILVGENGAGKTTVLSLLYYLLSGQWALLLAYSFDEISITIDNKLHRVKYSDLERPFKAIDPVYLRRLPPSVRRRVQLLLESGDKRSAFGDLEAIFQEYSVPIDLLYRQFHFDFDAGVGKSSNAVQQALASVTNSLDAQVLFLPTYRRIEQELSLIFKGLGDRELRQRSEMLTSQRNMAYVELIEFGMKDVEAAISSTLSQLNTFARENLNKLTFGYLGDIVEERYTKVDLSVIRKATDQTIENVLNRIQEHILSSKDKQHLRNIIGSVKNSGVQTEHTMIICHYFLKLLEFQKDIEKKETRIISFCKTCNEYMSDKLFRYDIATFAFTITSKNAESGPGEIKLSHLSSGEKQIVSLFSHLYLSGGQRYFVLIDEPELSLSVPWQRRFLADIRSGEFCTGLVAVTHSPFIYDNELRGFAHGLGEFSA